MNKQIPLPEKLIPVFSGDADVRGAYGGRGSGKTRSFALMAAVRGMIYGAAGVKGMILCARQFMNSLDDSSLEEIKRAIESDDTLSAYYELGDKYVRSKDGRIQFSFSGLDRNIASVKSKGRILLCWVDEAEPVTDEAWNTLIPTLREEGDGWNAELWVTWNPLRKTAPVEGRFRNSHDDRVKVVEMNWRDNPRFPALLERTRQKDMRERPEQYGHIWEGEYVKAITGAYYAEALTKAQQEGRIGPVSADPLLTLRGYVDIGGTGKNADSFALWVVQFVGLQVRVIDYYEAQGQPMAAHVEWMRSKDYTTERLQIWLPHDGATYDKVFAVTPATALQDAGYSVTVIPNQGRGAAMKRVEATRRLFPSIWFNAQTTEAGRDALGWYHPKKDEKRDIDLGPEHDWASHGADAFGLMCCDYKPPSSIRKTTVLMPSTGGY